MAEVIGVELEVIVNRLYVAATIAYLIDRGYRSC